MAMRKPFGAMNRTQAKRRLAEIEGKAIKLWVSNHISTKDMEAIKRIVKTRTNQLK